MGEAFSKVFRLFFKLSISGKLLLSYLSFLILLFSVSAYALININELNRVNASMLKSNFPVINATEKLIDLIIYQEQYARRYIILKDDDILKMFRERDQEIQSLIKEIKSTEFGQDQAVIDLERLQKEYSALLIDDLPGAEANKSRAKQMAAKVKNLQERMAVGIKEISIQAHRDLKSETVFLSEIGLVVFNTFAVLFMFGLVISLLLTLLITHSIVNPIRKLKKGTELMARGEFDDLPRIHNTDEIGDLSSAFRTMSRRLKELEELNLQKSPLTGLPGGVAIESALMNRIKEDDQIAFCLVDVDNFKSYNDYYGYGQGNEIIKLTARILQESVAAKGYEDDFVGHIGGDDFVFITRPDRYEILCESVIAEFDRTIPEYYKAEDRERGTIRSIDRQGNTVDFPLASLSIAVVTNRNKSIDNHIKFGAVAAELKEYIKPQKGSNYAIDRRESAVSNFRVSAVHSD